MPAEAQQPKKIPRIGYFVTSNLTASPERHEAFRQGLRELGYIDGKNIVIEYRYAEGKLDRLSELAAELVRLKVDIIVSVGPLGFRERFVWFCKGAMSVRLGNSWLRPDGRKAFR